MRLMLLLTALALALRLHGLAIPSLWMDEATSAWVSHQPAALILPLLVETDAHPPLYYFLLHGWIWAGGYSAFSLRYFSVLWGVLAVPLLYAAVKRLAGERGGLASALFAAFLPPLIIYAQEARAYSLVFALSCAALLALSRIHRAPRPVGHGTLALWTLSLLGGASAHYFALVVAGAGSLLGLALSAMKPDRRRWLRRLLPWLGVQAAGILVLAVFVWAQLPSLRDYGLRGEPPIALPDLFFLLWGFLGLGNVDLLRGQPGWTVYASGLLFVVALALLAQGGRPRAAGLPLALLALLLLPVMAYSRFVGNSIIHPRYTLWLAVPVLALAGVAAASGRLWRARGAILAVAFLLPGAAALPPYFLDPERRQDPVGEVAAYLEATAGAADLVLVSFPDQALHYYYRGRAPAVYLAMKPTDLKTPGGIEAQRLWRPPSGRVWHGDRELAAWLEDAWRPGARVYHVVWNVEVLGPKAVPFVLESMGRLEQRAGFQGYRVDGYLRTASPPESVDLRPAQAGPLLLKGIRRGAVAGEGEPLAIALDWVPLEPTPEVLRVALTVTDVAGRPLARFDGTLQNLRRMTTAYWSPRQAATTTYHVLPLPRGTPPGGYRLSLEVYAAGTAEPLELRDAAGQVLGRKLDLGELAAGPPVASAHDPSPPAGPPLQAVGTTLGQALRLLSARAETPVVAAGGRLRLLLLWQLLQPTGEAPELTAHRQGRELLRQRVEAPFAGEGWRPGETRLQYLDVRLPADLPAGPLTLTLRLGDARAELPSVEVESAGRSFEPPTPSHALSERFGDIGRLLGYDLEPRPDGLLVTLHWQAINAEPLETAYHTFVHLVRGEGSLLAQHDGPPDEGRMPTHAWIEGQFVSDPHLVPWQGALPQGAALRVGLYDPASMARLPLEGGGDFVLIPLP